jgi:hypothetical protein
MLPSPWKTLPRPADRPAGQRVEMGIEAKKVCNFNPPELCGLRPALTDSVWRAWSWSRSERSDGFAAQSLSKFRASRGQYDDINITSERRSQFLFQSFNVRDELEP